MAKPSQKAPVLKIKYLTDAHYLLKKHTEGSVGIDLYANEDIRIAPTTATERAYRVKSGIAMAIPEGYHGKIFLRSSTGDKTKLRLANGTAIIDSDYRGEIMFLVENVGSLAANIYKGDRLFQILIEKNEDFTVEVVEDLGETKRGTDGVGSTGSK